MLEPGVESDFRLASGIFSIPIPTVFTTKLVASDFGMVQQAKPKYLRDLIRSCYAYYGQEETLFLFDVLSGDRPHWTTMKEESTEDEADVDVKGGQNGWLLVSTESNRILWRFSSQYQVTALCALEAELIELCNGRNKGKPEHANQLVVRLQRQVSITDSIKPAIHSPGSDASTSQIDSMEWHSGALITADPIKCEKCGKKFSAEAEAVKHMVDCLRVTRVCLMFLYDLHRLEGPHGPTPHHTTPFRDQQSVTKTLPCSGLFQN